MAKAHYRTVEIRPAVISNVLVGIPEILDYQVQQTADGIDLTVLADGCIDDHRLRDQLAAPVTRVGLPDRRVAVRVAPTLPRHAETGKLRRFIPAS